MKEICFLQLFQIAVHRFIVDRTMLWFQIIRNWFCREWISHIRKCVPNHPFQLVDLANLVSLYDIRENRGIIDISDNRINLILWILSQVRCREAAQADIVCQFSMDILYLCILLFKFQIFLKRKRIDTEGNISSGQVSRYFRRHHSGIGACHIKVNIIIRCQGVYYFLPAFNFLNLIQKEIRSPRWI